MDKPEIDGLVNYRRQKNIWKDKEWKRKESSLRVICFFEQFKGLSIKQQN